MANPQKNKFDGVWTALATPFTEDLKIDWAAYESLLQLQLTGGVSGLVVSGTTGESPTLSTEEKLELIRHCRATVGPDFPIMAGTGGSNTAASIALSEQALSAGADSLLVVTPAYNKPSPAGMFGHFSKISDACGAPICLYHVPGRTAQSLSADELTQLAAIKHVAAVKEASGDLALFSEVVAKTAVPVLSGDDLTYLPSLSVGGRGCISVLSNIFPKALVSLTSLYENGDGQQAAALHRSLLEFTKALFCESNPGPLKAGLAKMGIMKNTLRAPLAPVTAEHEQLIVSALCDLQSSLER